MSLADKYNHTAPTFTHQLPDNAPFKSLKELYNGEKGENKYIVRGIYINKKGKYGDAPVAISEDFSINLPSHLCDTVTDMLKDGELIEAINAGKFGLEVYEYTPKGYKDKTCYSVRWVDM